MTIRLETTYGEIRETSPHNPTIYYAGIQGVLYLIHELEDPNPAFYFCTYQLGPMVVDSETLEFKKLEIFYSDSSIFREDIVFGSDHPIKLVDKIASIRIIDHY